MHFAVDALARVPLPSCCDSSEGCDGGDGADEVLLATMGVWVDCDSGVVVILTGKSAPKVSTFSGYPLCSWYGSWERFEVEHRVRSKGVETGWEEFELKFGNPNELEKNHTELRRHESMPQF